MALHTAPDARQAHSLVLAEVAVQVVLHSPIDADETRMRLLSLLALGRSKRALVGVGDYRFAFDCSVDELLVLDPGSGNIIDINQAFERGSGYGREQRHDQSAAPLLGLGESQFTKMHEALKSDGMVQHRSRRSRRSRASGGGDTVNMALQAVTRDGQPAHLLSLRDCSELEVARMSMDLLPRLQSAGKGEDRIAALTRLLADFLHLDYVAVYAVLPEFADGPHLLARELLRPFPTETPESLHGATLTRVLDGCPVWLPTINKQIINTDDFIAKMQFAAFAGLPLFDQCRNMLGVLLVGSSTPWDGRLLLAETLRIAATRFGSCLELRRAREQGRIEGLQDGLTGLPNHLLFNHLLFNDRLKAVLREAYRSGEMFAVLFVDLDRVKSINDSFGHSVGDKVLNAVAQRLSKAVCDSDMLARYAGERFTIILRHIVRRDDVKRIVEKVIHLMNEPLTLSDDSELHMAISIGISFYPDDAIEADELLKYADVAMYNAKSNGAQYLSGLYR